MNGNSMPTPTDIAMCWLGSGYLPGLVPSYHASLQVEIETCVRTVLEWLDDLLRCKPEHYFTEA